MRIKDFDFEQYDNEESFKPIRKNTKPVNDGHDFKKSAENWKNRAFNNLARKMKGK